LFNRRTFVLFFEGNCNLEAVQRFLDADILMTDMLRFDGIAAALTTSRAPRHARDFVQTNFAAPSQTNIEALR